MKIEQFEDKGLAHYAYAVLNENTKEIILIDPARNSQPYLDFAQTHGARITGVIETHPHADFVSSHLELHQLTGANIYVSKLVGAEYPHQSFDEGDTISLGNITLRALNTHGHSPDSISVVVNHNGQDQAVFTGDTLFIGDVGFKTVMLFGLPSLITVFLTRRFLIPALPEVIFRLGELSVTKNLLLMVLFGILMMLASYSMITKKCCQDLKLNKGDKINYGLIIMEAIAVGLISGLVGAGGGFLIIPVWLFLFGKT